jgi:hypothetical protein
MLGRGNPGNIRVRLPESDPSLAASVPGASRFEHHVAACEIFMVPAYAIKSIVLIDFCDVVKTARAVPSPPPKQLLLNLVF